MKKAILIYILTLAAITVFSQKWEHTIGEPDNYEASRRVMEHYDKGYLISAQNEDQGWLVKTDINGNVLWDKVIGIDPDKVITEKTVVDEQGNLYVFGLLLQDFEPYWPLAIKLNACGELLWCRNLYFDEYEDGSFYDAIMLENGDLLALACMPDETLHDMIFLFCISPDGDYKWKKSYASKDNHPLFSTRLGSRIQFFDDIYIISGYVYSPHPDYPTITSLRPMFIGIDTLFNEQWVLEFGMVNNMKGKAVESIAINDTLYMGMGRYRYDESTGETKDAWAMIYNQQGQQTGYVVITKEQLDNEVNESTFYEVERINDTLYLGSAGYFFGEEETTAGGEIVFDTAGNVYNYTIIENLLGHQNLTKTFDDKYLVSTSYWNPDLSFDIYLYKRNENLEHDTMYPGNYTYDSLCTELPILSGTIDLAGCGIITRLEEIPWLEDYNKQENNIKVVSFPNPVEGREVTISYLDAENLTPPSVPSLGKLGAGSQGGKQPHIAVYNVFGELVFEERIYEHQGESKLDVSEWSKGMYLAVIYSNGLVVGNCKFIIK